MELLPRDVYILSSADSVTGTRDCNIGACTDTRGKFGSTTVVLSGIDVVDVTAAAIKSMIALPDKCVYGNAVSNAVLKVGRDIWSIGLDDARTDPFYLVLKRSDYDQNLNYSGQINY
jgi:hypothetical protein